MWLIIYRRGVGWPADKEETCYSGLMGEPPPGAYDESKFEIKEWFGPLPRFPELDPLTGVETPGDPDPTLADPDYAEFWQARVDFDALAELADAEVDWLEGIIPTIADPVVKRLAQENLRMIKAWRYVLRRFR